MFGENLSFNNTYGNIRNPVKASGWARELGDYFQLEKVM